MQSKYKCHVTNLKDLDWDFSVYSNGNKVSNKQYKKLKRKYELSQCKTYFDIKNSGL